MKAEPRPSTTVFDNVVRDPDGKSGCSPGCADNAACESLRQGEAAALFVDVLGFRSLCEREDANPAKPLSVIRHLESLRGSWWVKGFDLHSYRISDSVVFVLFSNRELTLTDCAKELVYVAKFQVIQKLLDYGLLVQGGIDIGCAYSDPEHNVCFGPSVSGAYAMATRSPVLPRISISPETSAKLRLRGKVTNVGMFLNDPTPMVDYLGIRDPRQFRRGDTTTDDYMDLLKKHKAAVLEHIKYASDPASVSKCTWLFWYHNSAVEGILDAGPEGRPKDDEDAKWWVGVQDRARSLLIRGRDVAPVGARTAPILGRRGLGKSGTVTH